jgi:hypothetical protein
MTKATSERILCTNDRRCEASLRSVGSITPSVIRGTDSVSSSSSFLVPAPLEPWGARSDMPRKSKKMPMANIYDRSLSNTWQLHRTNTLLKKAEEMNRRKITHTTMNNNTEKQKKKKSNSCGLKAQRVLH